MKEGATAIFRLFRIELRKVFKVKALYIILLVLLFFAAISTLGLADNYSQEVSNIEDQMNDILAEIDAGHLAIYGNALPEGFHFMDYPLIDENIFRMITGAAFRQRRKMVRNTLIPFFVSRGIGEPSAMEIFQSAGIDIQLRPESLTVDDFVKISNSFVKMCSKSYTPEIRP